MPRPALYDCRAHSPGLIANYQPKSSSKCQLLWLEFSGAAHFNFSDYGAYYLAARLRESVVLDGGDPVEEGVSGPLHCARRDENAREQNNGDGSEPQPAMRRR
jgi:hypothetical protein